MLNSVQRHDYKLEFLHGGKTLTTSPQFRIISQSGLSASDYAISAAELAGQDGSVVTNTKTLARQIDFIGDYSAPLRQQFVSFFRPKTQGMLTVTYNGTTRMISYYVSAAKWDATNIWNKIERFTLRLLCPDPYFMGMDDYGQNIASRRDIFAFPFVFTEKAGIITDFSEYGGLVSVENLGDMPTPITVEIEAKAFVSNPKFENVTTGEHIEMNMTMTAGDILILDTGSPPTAKLNGGSATKYDRQSKANMRLLEGINKVRYSAKAGSSDMSVTLRYRPKYLGI